MLSPFFKSVFISGTTSSLFRHKTALCCFFQDFPLWFRCIFPFSVTSNIFCQGFCIAVPRRYELFQYFRCCPNRQSFCRYAKFCHTLSQKAPYFQNLHGANRRPRAIKRKILSLRAESFCIAGNICTLKAFVLNLACGVDTLSDFGTALLIAFSGKLVVINALYLNMYIYSVENRTRHLVEIAFLAASEQVHCFVGWPKKPHGHGFIAATTIMFDGYDIFPAARVIFTTPSSSG